MGALMDQKMAFSTSSSSVQPRNRNAISAVSLSVAERPLARKQASCFRPFSLVKRTAAFKASRKRTCAGSDDFSRSCTTARSTLSLSSSTSNCLRKDSIRRCAGSVQTCPMISARAPPPGTNCKIALIPVREIPSTCFKRCLSMSQLASTRKESNKKDASIQKSNALGPRARARARQACRAATVSAFSTDLAR